MAAAGETATPASVSNPHSFQTDRADLVSTVSLAAPGETVTQASACGSQPQTSHTNGKSRAASAGVLAESGETSESVLREPVLDSALDANETDSAVSISAEAADGDQHQMSPPTPAVVTQPQTPYGALLAAKSRRALVMTDRGTVGGKTTHVTTGTQPQELTDDAGDGTPSRQSRITDTFATTNTRTTRRRAATARQQ